MVISFWHLRALTHTFPWSLALCFCFLFFFVPILEHIHWGIVCDNLVLDEGWGHKYWFGKCTPSPSNATNVWVSKTWANQSVYCGGEEQSWEERRNDWFIANRVLWASLCLWTGKKSTKKCVFISALECVQYQCVYMCVYNALWISTECENVSVLWHAVLLQRLLWAHQGTSGSGLC